MTDYYHAGYHLPHCRNMSSPRPHRRRAFVLGKRPEYFSPDKYAWDRDLLPALTKYLGNGFEFVGGAGGGDAGDVGVKGISNLGRMDKPRWNQEVAESAVLASQCSVADPTLTGTGCGLS